MPDATIRSNHEDEEELEEIELEMDHNIQKCDN